MTGEQAGTLVYAYVICRGLAADRLAGEPGIGGAPLDLVEHGGLAAVVSAVPADEFDEAGLPRNLEDLCWLENVARTHDRVARLASRHALTAPLRLATVFLTADGLREQLARWHDRASAALDRIRGRSEWRVEVYAEPVADPGAAGEPVPDAPVAGSGRASLVARESAWSRADQAGQDAQTAERLHGRLASSSVAGRRLPPPTRRPTGHTGEMVLNGAYLLDRGDEAGFRALVAELDGQDPRIRAEATGPWPPYAFAMLELP